MQGPFFSIIIPSLNEAKYLPKLIDSLTLQTFRDFEVILVDGSSQDKTVANFNKYTPQLPSAHVFVVEKKNVGYQRNYGAKNAKGTYLVFLDADVDVQRTFLEELHIAALKHDFPFATTWIAPDSNKSIDQLMLLLGNLGQELAKGIKKPFSGGYNTIIKKEYFDRLRGFREDLKINEDHDLAMRADKTGIPLTILKEPQVIYSLRRFRSEGTLTLLQKYARGQIHTLLVGPITTELFDYRMGGHVHKKKKKNIFKTKVLSKYIQTIEKLQNKFLKILLD